MELKKAERAKVFQSISLLGFVRYYTRTSLVNYIIKNKNVKKLGRFLNFLSVSLIRKHRDRYQKNSAKKIKDKMLKLWNYLGYMIKWDNAT